MKISKSTAFLASAGLILLMLVTPLSAFATSSVAVTECASVFSGSVVSKMEFMKALLNDAGFDPSSVQDSLKYSFSDVSGEDQAYAEKLRQLGVVNYFAENPIFRPNDELTTRKAIEILFKFKGMPVAKVIINAQSFKEKFSTIPSGSIFAPVIEKAFDLGLIDSNFNMSSKLTGADANSILCDYKSFEKKLSGASTSSSVKSSVLKVTVNKSGIEGEAKFNILSDVWKRATKDFYGRSTVNRDALMYGAITGLVNGLNDPYSQFQEPSISKAFKDTLTDHVEGIGASMSLDADGNLTVISPLAGSPAEKAGLRARDIIEKIDGVSVDNSSLAESISKIKGAVGTSVTLTVKRGYQTFDITIIRASISIPNVSAEITSSNIAVFKIASFGVGSGASFATYLDQLDIASLKGVIVDVRNNPGGYLDEAVDIAGQFMSKGQTVVKIKYSLTSSPEDKSNGPAVLKGLPLVVLINGGSASASEILAAALKDKAGATLIGEKSYGKGTVQELINYSDNSALKLTVAHWITPNGKDVNGIGVSPDISVKPTESDLKLNNDPQLNRALNFFK